MTPPTAVLTGASRGLGAALVAATVAGLPSPDLVTAVPGDVADPAHRAELAAAAGDRLDLLVHNASDLGPTPLPPLADLPAAQLQRLLAVNVVAPLALTQRLLPALRAAGG